MSRPTREESIYRVSIHRNGGYRYASGKKPAPHRGLPSKPKTTTLEG